MKLLSKITAVCVLMATITLVAPVAVKADNGMPSQVVFLQKQMEIQKAEIAKAKDYFKLQEARAKAEKRPISDIEVVKRQALEGIVQGDSQLLEFGNTALSYANVDPNGAGNIAIVDQAAYDGYVAGMANLEAIKQQTWMQYTFRTH